MGTRNVFPYYHFVILYILQPFGLETANWTERMWGEIPGKEH